jgi:CDP-diacylglycerol---glycerol-3-phosphate 3-phosphatidyltransferase
MIRRLFSIFPDIQSNLTSETYFHQSASSKTSNVFRDKQLDNFQFLLDFSPCFPVNGKCVKVIKEPKEFYNTIITLATNAKFRISLASLYIGVGKLETDLINAIAKSVSKNPSMNINILLDYTRGTRGKKSSKDIILPLLQQSEHCTLSLYHTPLLRGITKRLAPARWNELLGIQHMKIYLFDNTVLVSGANLSSDYFTNRQDRYIQIEDERLATFFSELIGKVQEFSMTISSTGTPNMHKNWKLLPYDNKSDHKMFAAEARSRLQKFFKKTFEEQKNVDTTDADTWIFPTLEMGQLNIHHDSLVMKRIVNSAEIGSSLKMATGYFNLTQNLMDAIVKDCNANCSIIMAHPNCNGFKNAGGPAGGIPSAYTLLARQFLEKIKTQKEEDRISLLEYERASWTYHAKGIWYYPNGLSAPFVTVFGSSNYGERSVNRDLESQLCLVTTNLKLQTELKNEYENLARFAKPAEKDIIERLVPYWVKTVVFLFKDFF